MPEGLNPLKVFWTQFHRLVIQNRYWFVRQVDRSPLEQFLESQMSRLVTLRAVVRQRQSAVLAVEGHRKQWPLERRMKPHSRIREVSGAQNSMPFAVALSRARFRRLHKLELGHEQAACTNERLRIVAKDSC